MSQVTVEYHRRARRFEFGCTCGWRGDTASLYRVTAAFEEHLRVCQGTSPFPAGPYRPERYKDSPITYPKPPDAQEN